jgi:4-amino-4-deoxy-L-arabinose transferase-like glycosyltransferase
MALAWLLAVVAFAKAVETGQRRWGAASGACFGLALLTKINAVFLPLVFVGWGVGFWRKRAVWPLVWTLGLGVVVFFVGWPWLWLAPLEHVRGYLFPNWRVAIPVLYFGRVYEAAPWHYPLVMAAVTIPVGILFLVILGMTDAVRTVWHSRPRLWGKGHPHPPSPSGLRRTGPALSPGEREQKGQALLLVNVAVGLGVFALPWLPKYDGVRLFEHAFPFLAILAGLGGQRAWRWVASRRGVRSRRPLFLASLLFVTQAGAVALIHPFELSYYNALTFGLWGADRIGMETTYWHECVNREVFDWLNRRAQRGQVIAFYPVGEQVVRPGPRTPLDEPNDFYEVYYLDRKKALRATRLEGAARYDFLVLNARKALLRGHAAAWEVFATRTPIFEVRKHGVLLVAVYGRE